MLQTHTLPPNHTTASNLRQDMPGLQLQAMAAATQHTKLMSLSALRKGGAWSAMKAAQWSGVMAYSCKPCLIESVYARLSTVKRLLTMRGRNTRASKRTDALPNLPLSQFEEPVSGQSEEWTPFSQ